MTVSKAKGTEPLISHHFNNLKYGNTATDEKGRIQSVFSMQVSHPKLNKGKPTLIPSIYDGKVLDEDAAIKAAVDSGIKWTSADSHEELRKYDTEIHKRMSPSLGEKTDREAFGKGGTVQRNINQPNKNEPGIQNKDTRFLEPPIRDPWENKDYPIPYRYSMEQGPPQRGAPRVPSLPPRPATERLYWDAKDRKIRKEPIENKAYADVKISGGGEAGKSGSVYYQDDNGSWNKTTLDIKSINAALDADLFVKLGENYVVSTGFTALLGKSSKETLDAGTKDSYWNMIPQLRASITGDLPGDWGRAGVMGRINPKTQEGFLGGRVNINFNRGGTMALQEQMSMFDDGGMMDEGNSVDPVSGNQVPVGSLQEEVRDDVPAQVSAGEYVVPADVVRYFGLEFFMQLRDKAKHGLARMEDIGQMGNAEEAPLEADSPFAQDDVVLVMGEGSGKEPLSARGGSYVPTAEELGDVPAIRAQGGSYIPTAEDLGDFPAISAATGAAVPTGWKSPGASGNPNANSLTPLYSHTVNYTNDEGLIKVVAVDTNGKPMYGVPPGYKPPASTPMAPADITTPTPVIDQSNESGASGVGDVGDSSGGKSVGEMSPAEQAAYAQEMKDNPLGSAIVKGFDYMTSAALSPGIGIETVANVFGKVTGMKDNELSFVRGLATEDLKTANKALAMKNDPNTAAWDRAVAAHTAAVAKATEVAVKGLSDAAKAAALSKAFGATSTQVLTHAQAVSSGNAPAGSSANSFGGHTTTGAYGYSTNNQNDVVGAAAVEQAKQARDLGIEVDFNTKQNHALGHTNKELQKQIDRKERELGPQDTGPSPDTGTVGGPATQAPGTESDDTGPMDQPDTPNGGLFNVGGLIQRPKRKAKNTKKKRRGLASR